ncbi:histidine phosphatase family protein [bacterium]|nr:MAG: histidine phosphatase family protein [bacterium]
MRLILVRHGQTDFHDPKRAQGHLEVPLNATGKVQAALLAKQYEGIEIDRLIASPLGRAQETARALGRPIETRPEVRERSYGEWEGSAFGEVNEKIAALGRAEGTDDLRGRPPGGESFADVWERTRPFVDELLGYEGTTMVVSHGGALAVMVAQLISGTLETVHSLHFYNCSTTQLERRDDGHVLLHCVSVPVPGDPALP